MDQDEAISIFTAALNAFEIRFERELDSRWGRLEQEMNATIEPASLPGKGALLWNFFDAAVEEIAAAIHQYFPRMLQVAAINRIYLGDQSPLSWTEAQVRRQVWSFLGIDEKFDETSPPRDDSLVLRTAARITSGVTWLDDWAPAEFRLPWWVDFCGDWGGGFRKLFFWIHRRV